MLAVRSVDAERAARATTTALQSQCDNHAERSVDLTTFEPHNPPAWLAELSIEPFYSVERVSTGRLLLKP